MSVGKGVSLEIAQITYLEHTELERLVWQCTRQRIHTPQTLSQSSFLCFSLGSLEVQLIEPISLVVLNLNDIATQSHTLVFLVSIFSFSWKV